MISEYWQSKKDHLSKIEADSSASRILDKSYIEQEKAFLYGVVLLENRVDLHLLVGSPKKAENYARLGYYYAKKAKEIEDRSFFPKRLLSQEECEYFWNYYLYKFKWIVKKKEDLEIINEIIKKLNNLINVEKEKKKSKKLRSYLLSICFFLIKLEQFQTALDKITPLTAHKTIHDYQKAIFGEELFLSIILRHLSGEKQNETNLKQIISAFDRFFIETNKANPLIIKLPLFHLIEFSYIYFRFFFLGQKKSLDPIQIVKSIVQKSGA